MKEISDIITAFEVADKAGKKCALATVVNVEGSSYRRPGARMLVTDDGMLTGAISGGCLEGDALRKALLAISQGKNKLVTYDTTDEDDAKFAVQLGCNGIVHILFEPINKDDGNNPVLFLKGALLKRENNTLVTLFCMDNKHEQIGTCLLINQQEETISNPVFKTLSFYFQSAIDKDIRLAFQNHQSLINIYQENERQISAFIQFLLPPVSLLIVGAGNDALPIMAVSKLLGWDITIIDGRKTHATRQRFFHAKNIIVASAGNAFENICFDETTVCVLMTHNYNYDTTALIQLLKKDVAYIGVLGPRSKMLRMYDDIEKGGIMVTPAQKNNIYSPVGLDIGAETPEEIALSVVAEIKAVLMKKNAQMLRNKKVAIHS